MRASLFSLPAQSLQPLPTSPAPRKAELPQISGVPRQGPLLQPTPLGPPEEVLGLNVARGCAFRCGFCCIRAYPSHPGDDVLTLYTDLAERLDRELTVRPKPKAVFVSPSTDPFPPLTEVQKSVTEVVKVLSRHGIESWLMTRGLIRPPALEVLTENRERVRVTLALTTADEELQTLLEPAAASPAARLRQVARLRDLGIPVRVAIDPLVPGVTDTRQHLSELLDTLAEAGVRQVTASYLFLREGIEENLRRSPGTAGLSEVILEAFRGGPLLTVPGLAPARYLPKARRQRGYALLMSLAAGYGIQVSVNALSNPDFSGQRRPRGSEALPRLHTLFVQAGQPRPRD